MDDLAKIRSQITLRVADQMLAEAREKREARLRQDAAAARGERTILHRQVIEERALRSQGMEPVPMTRSMRAVFGQDAAVWVGPKGTMAVQREGIRRTAFGHLLHRG